MALEQSIRELYISRIISGCVRLHIEKNVFLVKKPSREAVYIAQEIYQDALGEAKTEEMYSEKQLIQFLFDEEQWSDKEENRLAALPNEIEKLKVALYESAFKSQARKSLKKVLGTAKKSYIEHLSKRHAYDHLSCSGYASLVRSRYILAASLYFQNDKPFFDINNYWKENGDFLDEVLKSYDENRLSDEDIRELSRTDPWRSIWNSKKTASSLFGIAAVDYTDEQKSLVGWSQLYDSIHESPNCPTDEVLEDDDLLDGWLIIQRQNKTKADPDALISNEKVRNSSSIFLPVDSFEDAQKLNEFNSPHAKQVKSQRFKTLMEKGHVNEIDMPDTKQKIQMGLANMGRNKV